MADIQMIASIISHPIRKELLNALTIQLDEQSIDYIITTDKEDNIKNNVINALKKADTNIILLQDDILLGNNFLTNAKNAINAKPNDFISYFALSNYINAKQYRRCCFVYTTCLVQTVALSIPFKYIYNLIEFMEGYDYERDDEVISLFLKENNLKCYYTIPSLVEHIGRVSLTKENPPYRRANWFIKDFTWKNNGREEYVRDIWNYRMLKKKLEKFKV